MNLNTLAKEVTLREGKKKSISIAQVKEVIGIIAELVYVNEDLHCKLERLGKKRLGIK